MAKALPIKTKRQCTAAYAASQPLFDTLRTGMERVKDQRANLQTARDTVQKLHVKLPPTSIAEDARDSHEKYMDGAVKAWRLATQSYADIFEALADVTAAEPSAGREKRDGHEAFVKMAATARDAHEVAMDWKVTTPRGSVDSSTRGGQTVDEDESMQDVSANNDTDVTSEEEAPAMASNKPVAGSGHIQVADNRPINPVLTSLLKKQRDLKIDGVSAQQLSEAGVQEKADAAQMVPEAAKKDNAKLKRLEKRRKKREKRTQKKEQEREASTGQVKPVAEAPSTKPQYEDVSAEVAARLKAKEVKKEATKEKKRKRESRDSLPNGNSNDEVVMKLEKPEKKKAKSNEGAAVVEAAKTEKAKKHAREVETERVEGVHVEGRKKRKTA